MAVELPSSEAEVQALLESAVSSRASHIRRESETITMAHVRRLLESDLGLGNSALDAHKAFIRQLVDEVLLSSDDVEAQGGEDQKAVSEEVPKETSGSKRLKKSSGKKAREENGSVEDSENLQEEDVQKEAPKKKKQKEKTRRTNSKEEDEDGGGSNAEMSEEKKKKKEKTRRTSNKEEDEDGGGSIAEMSEEKKKQKEKTRRTSSKEEDEDGGGSNAEMSEEELHVEAPKKKQRKERNEEEISHSKEVDEGESGSHAVMSDDDSDVSEVKKAKKVSPKIASVKPVQNKKIEHLKKILKACGLTIPPQIYKRVKQQPDDKQDKFLIKELEDILSRRGLSSNPSDKEIKAAKQKIAREKDLEGIDTTNIILEPRGRRAQLFAPVYNPPPVEYDSEGDGEEESEDDGAEGSEGSEDEGKDFAAAEDSEGSD